MHPGFPGGSDYEESACSMGDLGSIPGLGRSLGEGNGYPLQYSCLEKSVGSQRAGHDWLTFSLSSTPSQRRTTDLHPQGQLGAVEISSQVGFMDLEKQWVNFFL